MVRFMKINNTVDCLQDSPVVDIHAESGVGVIGVNIKHLTVNKVNSIKVHY